MSKELLAKAINLGDKSLSPDELKALSGFLRTKDPSIQRIATKAINEGDRSLSKEEIDSLKSGVSDDLSPTKENAKKTDAGMYTAGQELFGTGLQRKMLSKSMAATDEQRKLKKDFDAEVAAYHADPGDAGTFDEYVINKYGKGGVTPSGVKLPATGGSVGTIGKLLRPIREAAAARPYELGGKVKGNLEGLDDYGTIGGLIHYAGSIPGTALGTVHDFLAGSQGPTIESNALENYRTMRTADTRTASEKAKQTAAGLASLASPEGLKTLALGLLDPEELASNIAMAGAGRLVKLPVDALATAKRLGKASQLAAKYSVGERRAASLGADAATGALLAPANTGRWDTQDMMLGAGQGLAMGAASEIMPKAAGRIRKTKIVSKIFGDAKTPDISAAASLPDHPAVESIKSKKIIGENYGTGEFSGYDALPVEERAKLILSQPEMAEALGIGIDSRLSKNGTAKALAAIESLRKIDPEVVDLIDKNGLVSSGQVHVQDAAKATKALYAPDEAPNQLPKAADVRLERSVLPKDADISGMTDAEQKAALAASDAAISKGVSKDDLHPLTHGPDAARRLKAAVLDATEAKNNAILADKNSQPDIVAEAKRANEAVANEKAAMQAEAEAALRLSKYDPTYLEIKTPTDTKVHDLKPEDVASMAEYASKEALLGNDEPMQKFINSFGSNQDVAREILAETSTILPVSRSEFVSGVKSHLTDAKNKFKAMNEGQKGILKSVASDVSAEGKAGAANEELVAHVDYLLTKPGNPAAKAELADILMKNPEVLIGAGLDPKIAKAAGAGSKVAQEEATKWIGDRRNHPKIKASFVSPQ